MYDPARDIFTSSEAAEGQPELEDGEISAGSEPVKARKRKRLIIRDSESPVSESADQGATPENRTVDRVKKPSMEASPIPMTGSNLPSFKKRKRDEGERRRDERRNERRENGRDNDRHGRERDDRRDHDRPSGRDRDRSHGRDRDRSREHDRSNGRKRSPSPPRRSPPRQLKRPGGASRLTNAEKEASRQRLLELERASQQRNRAEMEIRGVHEVVRQHYNAVPERGRQWRQSGSKIPGLRSFNNWVKSCIIQKFSPDENYDQHTSSRRLLVLDIGCGKGGDLGKWQQAPQPIELYVGIDPADVSIGQAEERYQDMLKRRRGLFDAHFFVKDAWTSWLGDVQLLKDVGMDPNVGPGSNPGASRWGGGGFDIVSMMFCMHYAFESEAKAQGMLKNVSGALKKGGRFFGVIPNSDVLSEEIKKFHQKEKPDEKEEGELEEVPEWGNDIYKVRFPGKTPEDGIFRPPFGWKYTYFLEEAVGEVPEYVVPWEAFRAMAEDYNLELQYRKPFIDIWKEEQDDRILGPLAERMKVKGRDGLLVSNEEMDAASFYIGFCFYKV